jgi:hypothetical protein
MSQTLVKYRIGRVILHSLCALQDHHWKWHLLGMEREFASTGLFAGERILSGRPASERNQRQCGGDTWIRTMAFKLLIVATGRGRRGF